MKNLLIALLLCCFACQLNAQTTNSESDAESKRMMELMSQKIEMDIDEDYFIGVATNTYVSESPKAVIMAMLVPESYEASKEKMMQNTSDDFVIENRGEKEMNGVKVLFMEGSSDAEGVKMNNTVYCIKYDDQTCMMIVGIIEQTADKKYFDMISRSMNSVVKAY